MICNRQIYNFFHHKNHQTTQDHRKKKGETERKNETPPRLWCLGSFTPFDPTGTRTHTRSRKHKCTRTHKHMHYCSHANTSPSVSHSHTENESLWGHCVTSMSLSLVVKTLKHRMSGLRAAVRSPPRAEKPRQNAEESMSMTDPQNEGGGGSGLELIICTDAGISRTETGSVHFSLLWDTTQGAHRAGTFARLMGFKKSVRGSDAVHIWSTRQKCRVSEGRVQNTVAGLAEEGRLTANR